MTRPTGIPPSVLMVKRCNPLLHTFGLGASFVAPFGTSFREIVVEKLCVERLVFLDRSLDEILRVKRCERGR
jgi:hypothetical protein